MHPPWIRGRSYCIVLAVWLLSGFFLGVYVYVWVSVCVCVCVRARVCASDTGDWTQGMCLASFNQHVGLWSHLRCNLSQQFHSILIMVWFYYSLSIHQVTNTWAVSNFWLLWYKTAVETKLHYIYVSGAHTHTNSLPGVALNLLLPDLCLPSS
jgi:hypothetical protein